jgi:hypothetical protein
LGCGGAPSQAYLLANRLVIDSTSGDTQNRPLNDT